FNAGKIDEFVTSMGWIYTDRFGNKHYTIEGINYLAQQVMNAFGYVTLTGVTFTTGATVSTPNEVLFNPADNSYYKWTGSFAGGPKVVPEDSTPETTGGIGPGAWINVGDTALRSELKTGNGSLVNTRYGTLDEYVEKTPSLLATKYMDETEMLALESGDLSVNHQPKVQQVMDEAHRLKCSVYFPPGTYCFDTAVNVWSYVRSVWGDGSAIITRRYGSKFISGTTNIDPAHDTRKLFRMMGGAVGSQSIHGLIIDGGARRFTVPKHTDTDQSLPNQTYYGDVEPADVGPYIFGPDGQTPVSGTSWYNHDKKESGLSVYDMVFKDQPGGGVVGNGQNIRVFCNHFMGWYDHAVYIAGSNFTASGDGILCGDIAVTGNVFRNRINSRGNGAVKGRFGFTRYAVTGNSFDINDYCLAFETGNGNAQQPWGQITVTGNVCNSDGLFMQIGNEPGTQWFNTGWISSIVIANNVVKSLDRIFLLGVSGSSSYVMDGYSVQISSNRFYSPTFLSMYTYMTNTEWMVNGNIIEITGTSMITGVDQPSVNNSELHLKNNVMGVLRTDLQGNAAISNFQRVAITGNHLRNLYFQVGSYTSDLTIADNEVDYTPTLATRNLALMYSGAGGGISRVKIRGNKFTGDVGRCQLKMSSNSQLDVSDNDFDGTTAPFIELHPTGYTPRMMRVSRNTMKGGGTLIGPLDAGVSLGSTGSLMEIMFNICMADNPTAPENVTLYNDTGAQSWVAHYQNIRCVKNSFKSALQCINATGSAQSGLSTSNKFWFGENATINSSVNCVYPSLNKANTDIVQTTNI
ncbi:hypothetical protein, partial [Citrobacter werkmanii]|uniref:tail fiber/spike domain-containing protein n=1 Tax=Citrobacter werkmanii TaxID=67827 RepID=UPI003F8D467B